MNWDYPELYYSMYPKIIQAINEHLGDDYSTEKISDEKAKVIMDDVYNKLANEYPEIDADPLERRVRNIKIKSKNQRYYYGRGRIIRDLISIFLISELLRRNRYGGNYPNPYMYPF